MVAQGASPRFTKIFHGGDYNPDQWPEHILEEDVRLMKLAKVNIASVAIFSWAQLEPEPGKFRWDWLDRTFERLHKAGVGVALATPSAAHPRWLSQMHPEVNHVDARGVRTLHGPRQCFCPTVKVFREHVARIDRALAERYGKHPALVLWHVSNEYLAPRCWCELCAEAFRQWLKRRYGSLEELNQQWWGGFWSQRYTDWSQVIPPFEHSNRWWQGLMLDWRRFQSDLMLDFFRYEVAAIREHSSAPVTTNLMGAYNGLDYAGFADAMDVISWDSYPKVGGDPGSVAFAHSLMRGLKGNAPWLLMEQTPSSTNWMEYATLKPPGLMRLWSWQAIGHGSNSVMYFQWRRSRGGPEKFHGAVVAHVGTEKPRVFREVAALGEELERLSEAVVATRPARAQVGVIWDQQNRWALELAEGPGRDKRYVETVERHFKAVWRSHIPVDVVRMDADWSQYKLLIAPMLYMVKSGRFPVQGTPEESRGKLDESAKLADWVASGGTFVTTYLSGIVNESDLVYEGGYPGPLRKLLGIWVEEIDNTEPGRSPNIMEVDKGAFEGAKRRYSCDRYFDLLEPEGAEVLARYGARWYAGRPCLTRNAFGKGAAWYIACDAEDAFLTDFYRALAGSCGIEPLAGPADHVEVLLREGEGRKLLFLLNHSDKPQEVHLGGLRGRDLLDGARPRARVGSRVRLAGYGVKVLELEETASSARRQKRRARR